MLLNESYQSFSLDVDNYVDSYLIDPKKYKQSMRLSSLYKIRLENKKIVMVRELEKLVNTYKDIIKYEINNPEVKYAKCIDRKKYANFIQTEIVYELEECLHTKIQTKKKKPLRINKTKIQNIGESYLQIYKGVKGVNINDIFEAKVLILYNVKYSKFTLLYAKDNMKFDLKGKSIINYDETKSICKKTRWEKLILVKGNLQRSWENYINNSVTTNKLDVTTLISNDVLIFKAFK